MSELEEKQILIPDSIGSGLDAISQWRLRGSQKLLNNADTPTNGDVKLHAYVLLQKHSHAFWRTMGNCNRKNNQFKYFPFNKSQYFLSNCKLRECIGAH